MASPRLRLQPGSEVGEFMELRMKPGSWERSGIPEQGCRIRTRTFEEMISNGGGYDADELIRGLMDWLDVTDDPLPAIAALRELLGRHYPPDERPSATCRFADENGAESSFIIGPVDRSRELVSWQIIRLPYH